MRKYLFKQIEYQFVVLISFIPLLSLLGPTSELRDSEILSSGFTQSIYDALSDYLLIYFIGLPKYRAPRLGHSALLKSLHPSSLISLDSRFQLYVQRLSSSRKCHFPFFNFKHPRSVILLPST